MTIRTGNITDLREHSVRNFYLQKPETENYFLIMRHKKQE